MLLLPPPTQIAPDAPRIEFQSHNVAVADLGAGRVIRHTSLRLPARGSHGAFTNHLVDGWFFWIEPESDTFDIEVYPIDEWEQWAVGGSIELRATHIVTGEQREWTLPALTDEERAERAPDVEELGWTIDEYVGACGLTADYPSIVDLGAGRFLLSETEDGRRHCVELGESGEVLVRHDLTPGMLWTPPVHATPSEALYGLDCFGRAWLRPAQQGVEQREFAPFELAPDPGWDAFTLDGRELVEGVRGSSFRSGDSWLVCVHTCCMYPMGDAPGGVGPGRGPYQETLVQLDAKTGEVIRREVIDRSCALHSAVDSWQRRMWGTPEALCALSDDPSAPGGAAIGRWCFAVARPTKVGWDDERVTVPDLPDAYGVSLVGEIEPGVALLRASPLSDDLTAEWVIVRAPVRAHRAKSPSGG